MLTILKLLVSPFSSARAPMANTIAKQKMMSFMAIILFRSVLCSPTIVGGLFVVLRFLDNLYLLTFVTGRVSTEAYYSLYLQSKNLLPWCVLLTLSLFLSLFLSLLSLIKTLISPSIKL